MRRKEGEILGIKKGKVVKRRLFNSVTGTHGAKKVKM